MKKCDKPEKGKLMKKYKQGSLDQMKIVLVCSQTWMHCRSGQMTGK